PLETIRSIQNTMKIINKYSIEAGLTVNEEKTEILSNYGEIIEKAWPMFKSKH
ncbi:Hypothetical protein FKW44_024074, partial [Caligus rogercresseyi]